MKKFIKKLAMGINVFLLITLLSCSDSFLDVTPKASLNKATLSTYKGVNALLIGAYSLLDGWATPEGPYRSYQVGADNWVYGSVASDDAYKGTIAGDQPPISLIEQCNIALLDERDGRLISGNRSFVCIIGSYTSIHPVVGPNLV